MKTGRKPKPTGLKVVTGNPGGRALPKNEPKPKVRIPTAPAHLSAPAKSEWKRVSKELYNLGLLSGVDRAALASYCQCYGRWRTAEAEIKKCAPKKGFQNGGLLAVTSNGNFIQNPLVGIANTAMRDMMRYAAEFGMTPSARTRIEASPLTDDEPEDEFFGDD